MRVLLAHDGSDHAAGAANLVGEIRWPSGSVLRVVSVIEPAMVPATTLAGGAHYSSEIDAELSAYYDEAVSEAVRKLEAPDRTVDGAVLRGRPATVITEEAQTFGADVVIVGSRGHGAIASLVLGSVSAEVVDHAPCPVLVARRGSLSRVLFATDGSPAAAAAEGLLSQWPIFAGLPIHVVSVADLPRPMRSGIAPTMIAAVTEGHAEDVATATEEHRRLADESAGRLRDGGHDADAEVRVGDAPAEIIAAAEAHGADLVVLGSRGRTGLTRLLLGSVARNVLEGSGASVLVVRERSQG
jgi:nucleotide-binding universal stress UspA family protein